MAAVHSVNIKAQLDAKAAQATAEKLHNTVKEIHKDSSNILVGPSTPSKSLAVAKKMSQPVSQAYGQELIDYGRARAGRAGTTGASARDFAQEAQGLGGLVRLYAMYAANVFAVSAAFTALSAAQDTANMIKGLNQLGASSGVALGTLSKQLVKVTDGAVSLREAMEATVKAQSSGMISKDILRMGEVAKKASQALGVNMSDALSRISRGITKLEPELLDELGIFTRIDPAVRAYAKSIGKTTAELSQFERQMAFSNAVLKEGESKFSEINIETNPYVQLLSKLKDLAFDVGNTINKVFGPIAKMLSDSPTALLMGMGALTAMLVKRAIPALGQLREGMDRAADAASAQALAKVADSASSRMARTLAATKEKLTKEIKAKEDLLDSKNEASIIKHVELEKRFAELAKVPGKTAPTALRNLIQSRKDTLPEDYTDEDLKILDQTARNKKAYSKWAQDYAESIREGRKLRDEEIADKKRHAEDVEAINKKLASAQIVPPAWSTVARNQRAAEKATMQSFQRDMVRDIGDTAKVDGIRAAWQSLSSGIATAFKESNTDNLAKADTAFKAFGNTLKDVDIKKPVASFNALRDAGSHLAGGIRQIFSPTTNLKKSFEELDAQGNKTGKTIEAQAGKFSIFSAATLGLKGTAGILAVGLQGVATALGNILGAVGLITGVFALMDAVFSTAGKSLDLFSSSVDMVTEAVSNLSDFTDRASKMSSVEFFSTKTMQAQATSIMNIADSLDELALRSAQAKKAVSSGSWFDKDWDFLKSIVGKDVASVQLKTYKDQLSKFAKLAESTPVKMTQLYTEVQRITGDGQINDVNALAAALTKLDPTVASELIRKFGVDVASTSSKIKEITQGLEASTEEFTKFYKEMQDKNPITQMSLKGMDSIEKLQVALKGSNIVGTFEAIFQLADQAGKGNPLFTPQIEALSAYAAEAKAVQAELKQLQKESSKALENKAPELSAHATRVRNRAKLIKGIYNTTGPLTDPFQEENAAALARANREEVLLNRAKDIGARTTETLRESFSVGAKIVQDSIEATLAKGATLFKQGVLGYLQGSTTKGTDIAKLQNIELGLEARMLQVQMDLLAESKIANIKLERIDTRNALSNTDKYDSTERARLNAKLSSLDRDEAVYRSKSSRTAKDAAADLSKSDTLDADTIARQSSMRNFALSIASLEQKLMQTGQQQRLNMLKGEIEDIGQKFTNKINAKGTEILELTTEVEKLQASLEVTPNGYFITKELILQNQERRTGLALDQKKLDADKDYEVFLKVLSTGQLNEIQREEYLVELNRKYTEVAEQRSVSEITGAKERSKYSKEYEAHLENVRTLQTQLLDLSLEQNLEAKNRSLELQRIRLDTEKKSGKYEFNEEAEFARTMALAQEELILSTVKSEHELKKKYAQERKSLEEKWLNAKDAAEEAALLNLLDASAQGQYAELEHIKAVRAARLEGIAAEIDARKNETSNKLTDGLASIISEAFFEGGKSGLSSLKSNVSGFFKDLLTSGLKKNLRGAGGLAGILGTGTAAAGYYDPISGQSTVGGGGGAMGMLGSIKSLMDAVNPVGTIGTKMVEWSAKLSDGLFKDMASGFSKGFEAVGTGQTSFTEMFSKSGAEFAGSIASSLTAGFTGYSISKGLSGGYTTGGNTVNSIAAIASAIFPQFAPIIGAIGGLINRAFGRKLVSAGIEGEFGGTEGFAGRNYEDYKGGWFRSDKTTYSDLDPSISKKFVQLYNGIKSSTLLTAGSLNIANSENLSQISNYKKSFKVDTQGLSAEDASRKIQEEFAKVADDMAKAFLTKTTTIEKAIQVLKESDGEGLGTYVIEMITESTSVLRDDLPRWMQDIVDLEGPTSNALDKIKAYPVELLKQFGVARDDVVGTFTEGLVEGKGYEAGQLVANQVVKGIELSMYQNAAGQIFDIMNQGIITPVLHAALTGQQVSEALSEATIQATIARATQTATTLASIFKDPGFKAVLDNLKITVSSTLSTIGDSFPKATYAGLPTTFAELENSANDAQDSVDSLAEKLKELAESSASALSSLFDKLTGALKDQASSIKSSISKVKDFVKSMLDFKTSLLLSDKSTLTSAEKYVVAKSKFDATYAKALTGDESSIDKLQGVSQDFLQASREFYASGSQYTQDFNTVLGAVDTAAQAASSLEQRLNDQLTDANKYLAILGYIDDTLLSIEEILEIGLGRVSASIVTLMDTESKSSYSVSDLVQKGVGTEQQLQLLLAGIDANGNSLFDKDELVNRRNIGSNTETSSAAIRAPSEYSTTAAQKAGIATYGADTIARVGGQDLVYSSQGAIGVRTGNDWKVQLADSAATTTTGSAIRALMEPGGEGYAIWQQGIDGQKYILNLLKDKGLSGFSVDALMGFTAGTASAHAESLGLPAFAKGTNFVPEDMTAQIHKGERIIPEADNRELMAAVASSTNEELTKAVYTLTQEVKTLKEVVARGSAMNVEATDRNTSAVVSAVSSGTQKSILASNLKERAQLV